MAGGSRSVLLAERGGCLPSAFVSFEPADSPATRSLREEAASRRFQSHCPVGDQGAEPGRGTGGFQLAATAENQPGGATYEQTVDFRVPEAGRYALQIEGRAWHGTRPKGVPTSAEDLSWELRPRLFIESSRGPAAVSGITLPPREPSAPPAMRDGPSPWEPQRLRCCRTGVWNGIVDQADSVGVRAQTGIGRNRPGRQLCRRPGRSFFEPGRSEKSYLYGLPNPPERSLNYLKIFAES